MLRVAEARHLTGECEEKNGCESVYEVFPPARSGPCITDLEVKGHWSTEPTCGENTVASD